MTRTQIVASAIGAALLAVAIPAQAEIITTTSTSGDGCHVEYHDAETGLLIGWADSPSEPCSTFTATPADEIFNGIVIDTGDGHATTGRAEAAPCLTDGDCIEVLPGVRVAAHEAPAVQAFLQSAAEIASIDPRTLPSLDWPVWDRLAECESTSRWNLRGRRHDGGLQFTRSSWATAGGLKFAGRAFEATREEQIVVARALLDMQGWSAWPSCSRRLGLR